MLKMLMAQVEELKSQRVASTKGLIKGKALKKEKKVYLKTEKVEGTGYKFWQVHKPVHITQLAADTEGKFFKSETGRRIRVFFVNKNFPQSPIVGAIELEPGRWDARVWNYNGGTRTPYSHGDNIVGVWEE